MKIRIFFLLVYNLPEERNFALKVASSLYYYNYYLPEYNAINYFYYNNYSSSSIFNFIDTFLGKILCTITYQNTKSLHKPKQIDEVIN